MLMELFDLLEPQINTIYNKFGNSKISIHCTQHISEIKQLQPHAFILGYKEYRNSSIKSKIKIADIFRNSLSQFHRPSQSISIVDIGNCIQGKTIHESYIILQEVLKILKEFQIPIIIIGGSHESLYYISKEIIKKIAFPSVTCIDSKIDFEIENEDFSHSNFIHKLIAITDTLRLINIGYQEYLCSHKTIEWFKSHYFPLLRLGKVRQKIIDTEPFIRDSHIVSIDASSIRYSDIFSHANPNGLYAEEACQLAWYAGYSQNLKIFCVHDVTINESSKEITSTLISQILWHVLDGISQQKNKKCDFYAEKFTKYYVQNGFLDHDITFFENILTKQLWVEVPLKNNKKKRIIPCSAIDYQEFLNNNLSENWLLEFNRLYNK